VLFDKKPTFYFPELYYCVVTAYGFEDGNFDSDENLSPLERLQQYLESDNIFNR
jgi:hypothetical protein